MTDERKNTDLLQNIYKAYHKAQGMSCKPGKNFSNPAWGTIFDEEKSVRWNREEVDRLRSEYEEEARRLTSEKNAAIKNATDMAIAYIVEDSGLPLEKAKILWDFLFSRYKTFEEIFKEIPAFIKLYNELLK